MCAQRVQLKTTIDGAQVPLNPYTDCVKNVRQQMPLAGSKLLGTTVLYVGPQTDKYDIGMCYTCKATESNSYYWEKVQAGSGNVINADSIIVRDGDTQVGKLQLGKYEQISDTQVNCSHTITLSNGYTDAIRIYSNQYQDYDSGTDIQTLLETPGIIISSDVHYNSAHEISECLLNAAIGYAFFNYSATNNSITWSCAPSSGTPVDVSVYTKNTALYTTLPGSQFHIRTANKQPIFSVVKTQQANMDQGVQATGVATVFGRQLAFKDELSVLPTEIQFKDANNDQKATLSVAVSGFNFRINDVPDGGNFVIDADGLEIKDTRAGQLKIGNYGDDPRMAVDAQSNQAYLSLNVGAVSSSAGVFKTNPSIAIYGNQQDSDSAGSIHLRPMHTTEDILATHPELTITQDGAFWCSDKLATEAKVQQMLGGAGGSAARSVFDMYYALSSETPPGAMSLEKGTLIENCDQVFPDFWEKCVRGIGNADQFPQWTATGTIRFFGEEIPIPGRLDASPVVIYQGIVYRMRVNMVDDYIPPSQSSSWQPLVFGTKEWTIGQTYTRGDLVRYKDQTWMFISGNGGIVAAPDTAPDGQQNAYGTVWGRWNLPENMYICTLPVLTESQWQAQLAATGYCDSFVVDTDAKSVRLPKISHKPAPEYSAYIQVYSEAIPASTAQAAELINMLDDKASAAELATYLPLSGGKMTGAITFGSYDLIGKADGTLTWGSAAIVTEAGAGLEQLNNILALASIVTAGNAGPTANASPGYGGTFTVPYITYDAYGRVTGRTNRTITMPSANAYITASSVSATKGYIKFSNKLLIQWGYVTVSGSVAVKTLTFPTAFANTTYTFVRTSGGITTADANQIRAYTGNSGSRTTTSINLYAGGNATSYSWIAIGTCS